MDSSMAIAQMKVLEHDYQELTGKSNKKSRKQTRLEIKALRDALDHNDGDIIVSGNEDADADALKGSAAQVKTMKQTASAIQGLSPSETDELAELQAMKALEELGLAAELASKSSAEARTMCVKSAEKALGMSSELISGHEKFIAEMLVDCVMSVGEGMPLYAIGIKTVPGGAITDSMLVDGVAFKKTSSYAGFEQQPQTLPNPTVLLISKTVLELKTEKDNAEVRLSSPDEYQAIVDAESRIIYEKLENIEKSGAQCVLSRLAIGGLATQWFADRGIICAGRVEGDDLQRTAIALGAQVQTTVNGLTPDVLGTCGEFKEVQLGAERMNLFTDCQASKFKTIIIRGGAQQFVGFEERSLIDAMAIVVRVLKSQEVARKLATRDPTEKAKDTMEAFARKEELQNKMMGGQTRSKRELAAELAESNEEKNALRETLKALEEKRALAASSAALGVISLRREFDQKREEEVMQLQHTCDTQERRLAELEVEVVHKRSQVLSLAAQKKASALQIAEATAEATAQNATVPVKHGGVDFYRKPKGITVSVAIPVRAIFKEGSGSIVYVEAVQDEDCDLKPGDLVVSVNGAEAKTEGVKGVLALVNNADEPIAFELQRLTLHKKKSQAVDGPA